MNTIKYRRLSVVRHVSILCTLACAVFIFSPQSVLASATTTITENTMEPATTPAASTTTREDVLPGVGTPSEGDTATTSSPTSPVSIADELETDVMAQTPVINQMPLAAMAVESAPTFIDSDIDEDMTLTGTGSPYVLGSTVVAQGVTLTIEAGAVLKFSGVSAGLTVNGVLRVQGSSGAPVIFTSYKDDAIGGDTNGDSQDTQPGRNDWTQVRIAPSGNAAIEHAEFRYGGGEYRSCFESVSACTAGLFNAGTLTATHISLHSSSNYLLQIAGGSTHITNSHFSDGTSLPLIYVVDGDVVIHHSEISAPITADGIVRRGVRSDGGTVDVRYNWWGSATGPSLRDVTKKNTNPNVEVALFGPWLTEPVYDGSGELSEVIVHLISGELSSSTVLRNGEVYVVREAVVPEGDTLVIEEGAIIKFVRQNGRTPTGITVLGRIEVLGSEESPVVFTEVRDDSIGGDTNQDGAESLPGPGYWRQLLLMPGSSARLSHVDFRYGGYGTGGLSRCMSGVTWCQGTIMNAGEMMADNISITHPYQYALHLIGGTATITDSQLVGSDTSSVVYAQNGASLHMRNSNIIGHAPIRDTEATYGVSSDSTAIDVRYNWWGHKSGPYNAALNATGLGSSVPAQAEFTPWLDTDPAVEPDCEGVCASNVMFLPGIQASRLYAGTEKVWEPRNNDDVRQLEMTAAGESVNQIHTRDVIGEIPFNGSIYAGFISYLNELDAQDVFNEWNAYAYDWRYDVFDIARDGTQYKTYVRELRKAIKALSLTSKTGKVTIVAHSNGGLLAKALLLEYPEAAEIIDNIVFVGSPQLGTPQAVATILHGYKQKFVAGLVMDDVVAREMIKNMPGVYGLLPAQDYFDATSDLVVDFDASETTAFFRKVYGNAINDEDELMQFMIGNSDSRGEAGDSPDKASKANVNLIREAMSLQSPLLSAWEAPEGISVTEIVGVGLDTESGFTYQEFSERVCRFVPFCEKVQLYKPIPRFTQYGDGTVVGASAAGYQGEKKTYYVDLESVREVTREDIKHSNLTESIQIQRVISDLLVGTTTVGVPFVSNQVPSHVESDRTLIGAHSPVSMYIEDTEGRVVGRKEGVILEEISGSSYRELGGSKYIIVPQDINFEVRIAGEAEGSMTLTVADLEGEEQTETIKVAVATITASTTILASSTDNSFGNLFIDEDGDGRVDVEMTPAGTVVEAETEVVSYDSLREALRDLPLPKRYVRGLVTVTRYAEFLGGKSSHHQLYEKLERVLLKKLQRTLAFYQRHGHISADEQKVIKDIIDRLIK